jgi:hypothetical protein
MLDSTPDRTSLLLDHAALTVKDPPAQALLRVRSLRFPPTRRSRLTCAAVTEEWHRRLGKAARAVREEARLIRSEVAGAIPCDQSVLQNFELGRSVPQNLDRVLDVYAQLGGLEGERDIWRRMLADWPDNERANGWQK